MFEKASKLLKKSNKSFIELFCIMNELKLTFQLKLTNSIIIVITQGRTT